MSHSALELELIGLSKKFSTWRKKQDRGVLVGVLLSCVPLPPVSLLGLVVGLANFFLIKTGRLIVNEKNLVLIGIATSLTNTVLASIFWVFIFHNAGFLISQLGMVSDFFAHLTLIPKIPNWLFDLIDSAKITRRETT
jgi:hypothetical protein